MNTTPRTAPIVLRDGIPLTQTADPFGWLLRHQGQSVDYATTHGGYAICTAEAPYPHGEPSVRGYREYLLQRERPTGWNGYIVRQIDALAALVIDAADGVDPYAAEYIVTPAIDAARHALDYSTGNLDLIRGQLDEVLRVIARRAGLTDSDYV